MIDSDSDSNSTATLNGGPARVEKETHAELLNRFQSCRSFTEQLTSSLETEDFVVQSMTDASPTKWHLAHTTWFFETFVLVPFDSGYKRFDDRFPYLFNSYYIQAGDRFSRPDRGMLTRPTVKEVRAYRAYVDEHIHELLSATEDQKADSADDIDRIVTIGINHEQQHQELMLTDIKHLFSLNPLYPAFSDRVLPASSPPLDLSWRSIDEGVYYIGTDSTRFHFDNEEPRHRYFIEPFELASRTVTNGEFLTFVEDGGYTNPLLWLSDGWATVQANGWNRPMYWEKKSDDWFEFTLHGQVNIDQNAPVCHLSYFEADAYARWAGARLPSEFEWEAVAQSAPIEGNFSEDMIFHPRTDTFGQPDGCEHLFGNVWEWTRSQYSPYPGFEAPPGALGEYNGKFMCNQFVLRGGSCATSITHIRDTYRNFFPPGARFQFAGIRLARDL